MWMGSVQRCAGDQRPRTASSAGTLAAGFRGLKCGHDLVRLRGESAKPGGHPPATVIDAVEQVLAGGQAVERLEFIETGTTAGNAAVPWLRWLERLSAAICPTDLAEQRQIAADVQFEGRPVGTTAAKRVPENTLGLPRGGNFSLDEPNCSGNAFGSPASLNASSASTVLAVWWPCVPPGSGGKRVTITSGWKVRITRTTSESTSCRSHLARVCS